MRAALLIEVVILPETLNLFHPGLAHAGWLLAAGAIGWACFLAGSGKFGSFGRHHSVAGIACSALWALAALRAFWKPTESAAGPAPAALAAISTSLLVLAMLSDVDRIGFWRRCAARNIALAIGVAAMIAAVTADYLGPRGVLGPAVRFPGLTGALATFQYMISLESILSYGIVLGASVFARRWRAGFRARILAPEK